MRLSRLVCWLAPCLLLGGLLPGGLLPGGLLLGAPREAPAAPAGRDWFVRAGAPAGDGTRLRPYGDPWEALAVCEVMVERTVIWNTGAGTGAGGTPVP